MCFLSCCHNTSTCVLSLADAFMADDAYNIRLFTDSSGRIIKISRAAHLIFRPDQLAHDSDVGEQTTALVRAFITNQTSLSKRSSISSIASFTECTQDILVKVRGVDSLFQSFIKEVFLDKRSAPHYLVTLKEKEFTLIASAAKDVEPKAHSGAGVSDAPATKEMSTEEDRSELISRHSAHLSGNALTAALSALGSKEDVALFHSAITHRLVQLNALLTGNGTFKKDKTSKKDLKDALHDALSLWQRLDPSVEIPSKGERRDARHFYTFPFTPYLHAIEALFLYCLGPSFQDYSLTVTLNFELDRIHAHFSIAPSESANELVLADGSTETSSHRAIAAPGDAEPAFTTLTDIEDSALAKKPFDSHSDTTPSLFKNIQTFLAITEIEKKYAIHFRADKIGPRLELKLSAPSICEHASRAPRPTQSASSTDSISKRPELKILHVEDEAPISEVMKRMLEIIKSYPTVYTTCTTGEEAIDLCKKRPFDCIFMDISLEGKLDGVETAEEILKGSPETIIFPCTSEVSPTSRTKYKNAGMQRPIGKPFTRLIIEASLEKTHELMLARLNTSTSVTSSLVLC
ncbi:MAG: response regulator [Simkaniaceae bacterium]|nr:response regulator [Simkaniaceae bacterium]MCF7852780.1 response regulator [Simkaniaceae bacterium]